MAPSPARAKVLVVDDERGPRESLRMILEPVCEVTQARSGYDALEILRTENIDLMTLDLNMPGMQGEAVMRTVRDEFPGIEIIVITGAGSVESAAESLRAGICDYLTKPFDVVQVSAAVARALSRRNARDRLTGFLAALGSACGRDREAEELLADVQRSQKMRGRLTGLFDGHTAGAPSDVDSSLNQTLQFLEVLAETIETKDAFMRGHARRVSLYSALLADRLNLSARDHELVRIAGFLHDLGKVGIPTDLLLHPGALEPCQRVLVEEHTEIGARLLAPLDIPESVAQAIRHHHEWWDGTGYADGLAGEEIPLASRIIAIADAFDAMYCSRPYREALPRDVLIAEFKRFSGSQFDPALAKEFLGLIEVGACDVDLQVLGNAVTHAVPGGQIWV
jgi:putative nucleotidyltransferase with HDIG domain